MIKILVLLAVYLVCVSLVASDVVTTNEGIEKSLVLVVPVYNEGEQYILRFYEGDNVKDVIQDFADRNRFTPLATATLLNETINKWNNRMVNKNPVKAKIPVTLNTIISVDESKGEDTLLSVVKFIETHSLDESNFNGLYKMVDEYFEAYGEYIYRQPNTTAKVDVPQYESLKIYKTAINITTKPNLVTKNIEYSLNDNLTSKAIDFIKANKMDMKRLSEIVRQMEQKLRE